MSCANRVVDHTYGVVVCAGGAGMRAAPGIAAAGLRWATGEQSVAEIRVEMQRAMQRHYAVFRDGPPMEQGCPQPDTIGCTLRDQLGLRDRALVFNNDLVEALVLDSMPAQAVVSRASANGRTKSRDAHARKDFPKRDDYAWLKHALAFRNDAGVQLHYRPVRLAPLSSEVASIPPGERAY